jgi:Fe(3+) dicitrate transport protein
MYRNRLGILVETDSLDQLYLYRTNIGDSRTRGVEFFAQYSRSLKENVYWVSMVSGSYMDSRYVNANVRSGTENVNIDGRFVESTPQWIVRAATELNHTSFGVKVLYSFVDQSFADALNTVTPNASASVGLVPAYQLVDLSAHYMINRWFKVQASVSNIFDEQYFTKRPQFYPGPGVWPSDGRTFSVAVAYNL